MGSGMNLARLKTLRKRYKVVSYLEVEGVTKVYEKKRSLDTFYFYKDADAYVKKLSKQKKNVNFTYEIEDI